MGRRKFQLGRTPKGCRIQPEGRRPVGRPLKKRRSFGDTIPSTSEPSVDLPAPLEHCEDNESHFTSSSEPMTWFQVLLSGIQLPSDRWVIQDNNNDRIAICKLSDHLSEATQSLMVTHCLIVKSDLCWTLTVHGLQISTDKCSVLSLSPTRVCTSSLQALISLLDSCVVCLGHPDEHFIQMAESKKGVLMSHDRKHVIARVYDFASLEMGNELFLKTVRVSTCEMLVISGKCGACVQYRDSLRKMHHRWTANQDKSPSHRLSTSSRANIRWLSTPEKAQRYSQLRNRLDACCKEVDRWVCARPYRLQLQGVAIM